MKTKSYCKAIILLGSMAGILLGCQKNITSPVVYDGKETAHVVPISALKTFLAGMLFVDESSIEYDSTTGYFKAFGKNQISETDLDNLYVHPVKLTTVREFIKTNESTKATKKL